MDLRHDSEHNCTYFAFSTRATRKRTMEATRHLATHVQLRRSVCSSQRQLSEGSRLRLEDDAEELS